MTTTVILNTPATQGRDITEYVAALQQVARATDALEHYWYVTGTREGYEIAERELIAAKARLRAAERSVGHVVSIDDMNAVTA
jgi:tRNA A58 N-methylase Trm61